MTPEQAKAIIAKHPDAISFVKSSHLEELSPLVEVVVEVVTVKKEDFHDLGRGTFYPKKETTDKFGSAAGISFASVETSTRREDDAVVGRAIPQEIGPDGKIVQWAAAEYEFDPVLRAEEDELRDEDNAEKNGWKRKYATDAAKRMLVLQYKKVARRRADTGARAAAIISAIGMPTGFKDIFGKNDPPTATREFLFSRIVANTKNELVLQRGLDAMFGQTQQLYGATTGQVQIEAPAASASATPADDGFGGFGGFGDEDLSEEDQARMDIVESLIQIRDEFDWTGEDVKLQQLKDTIENADSIDIDRLSRFYDKVREFTQNTGGVA